MVMLELYRNPRLPVPDYGKMDPLLLHLAFVSDAPKVDRDRLLEAGARVAEDFTTSQAGDQFVMLRDPWGVALQLAKRASPMLG
jgi:glyoxylase I family protein